MEKDKLLVITQISVKLIFLKREKERKRYAKKIVLKTGYEKHFANLYKVEVIF